jgi:cobalt ECF transporter T component CbiQ/cobalamin biosynthesis protein CbiM
MHIANGIVNGQVSMVFAAIAAGVLTVCVLRGRSDLDDRLAPMAGLVAAFIFAVQMLNFQVLPGVSGHLLGGTLAAILVGPWVGALCVSTVLIVQCLLFADGGLTALGMNITNMALLTTAAGFGIVALLRRLLPKTPAMLAVAAFVASVVSVVVASQGFVLEYWLGGTTDLSLTAVAGTLGGVHVLIGIGEGFITATTVATVARVRPDLVYALRGPQAPARRAPLGGVRPTRRLGWFLAGGLLVALILAGLVSNFASSSPDGLDATALHGCTTDGAGKITGGTCMAQQESQHQLAQGPLASYGIAGIHNRYLSTGLAGVAGVLITFGVALAIAWYVRRRRRVGAAGAGSSGRSAAGAAHVHPLHLHHDSVVHALAPSVKIVAVVLFTIIVVITPRTEFLAFAGYAALLAVIAVMARVPALWLAKRATIELPFVLLAVALPFAGHGERVVWMGMSLSIDGLYGAWNIFVKGTLGVLASLLLAATTTTRDLVLGLEQLHTPRVFTQIATFMLRYVDILIDDARRMRIARLSRGYDPRFLWQLKAFAVGVGALFLRAFERGERVYLAMISRGYSGVLPAAEGRGATVAQWAASALLPVAAAAIAIWAVAS